MNKISKYLMGSLVLSGILETASAQNTLKPQNVLFIAVDDLKPLLGCYGDQLIKTPNIDRLAARSTVFMKNYCQQALCGPTRASLLTGKRPDATKVWDLNTHFRTVNPNIVSLPEYFAQNNYVTAGIGKIYHGEAQVEDQDAKSWTIPYFNRSDNTYYNNQPPATDFYQSPATRKLIENYTAKAKLKGRSDKEINDSLVKYIRPSTECVDVPDDAYTDGAVALRSIGILSDLKKMDKAFIFAVGFIRPHLPFVAPKKYWDMYQREEMPVAKFQKHAENSPDFAYHTSGELKNYSDIPPLAAFSDYKTPRIELPIDKQKELIHGYYASVSYMDAQLGKILRALDSLQLTDNTIIILWGDHGWHLGDHDLWCKHSNFEQATHSPLMISAPTYKPGKTNSITEFVDVFPTLCDLAGLKIPENLDGKSLKPVMINNTTKVKDFAISQYPRGEKMGYSLRTDKYRLTWWMDKNFRSNQTFSNNLIISKELYDYENDPLETISIANDPKYIEIVKDLELKMLSFFENQKQSMKN